MSEPNLPIELGDEPLQIDASFPHNEIAQTHAGRKSHNDASQRPNIPTPQTWGRYDEGASA